MRFTEAKKPCSEPGPGLNSLLLAKASSFQQQGRIHNTRAASSEVEATGGRRGGREARPANTTLSGSCRPSPETRSRQKETAQPDMDHKTALPSSQAWVPVAPQPASTPSPQPAGSTAMLTPRNWPQTRAHPAAEAGSTPRAQWRPITRRHPITQRHPINRAALAAATTTPNPEGPSMPTNTPNP